MSELLPTEQAQDLRAGLLDYLTTTFALADQDARIALMEFLTDTNDGIFKGPFLRLRFPFRPADDGWQKHVTWTAPGFTPYRHQEEAFRTAPGRRGGRAGKDPRQAFQGRRGGG